VRAQILAEVSTALGPAMVGICDIKNDKVNFRDREGASVEDAAAAKRRRMAASSGHH
jgi:hypothetical protein